MGKSHKGIQCVHGSVPNEGECTDQEGYAPHQNHRMIRSSCNGWVTNNSCKSTVIRTEIVSPSQVDQIVYSRHIHKGTKATCNKANIPRVVS